MRVRAGSIIAFSNAMRPNMSVSSLMQPFGTLVTFSHCFVNEFISVNVISWYVLRPLDSTIPNYVYGKCFTFGFHFLGRFRTIADLQSATHLSFINRCKSVNRIVLNISLTVFD